jgi:AAA15 family ATPase/GTPase
MIRRLHIQNFKSIKDLKLDCSRVNIFIGEPNTGKSNIIEAVGIRSLQFSNYEIKTFVRFEKMSNLFYDNALEKSISILYDKDLFSIGYTNSLFQGNFQGDINGRTQIMYNFSYNHNAKISGEGITDNAIKYYIFKGLEIHSGLASDYLRPPHGDNLFAILETNNKIYEYASDIFATYGYELVLRSGESKIEIAKKIGRKLITFPYSLAADTLQRIVFYVAAMETNSDSTLVFEEPESFAFPFYTQQLAEKIGAYNSNQFFITTHNPYFLMSIIEKTPIEELRVYITYYENYETKVKLLSKEQLSNILTYNTDLFFNLNKYINN